jgi:uncharacterized protein (TIGR02246 family)
MSKSSLESEVAKLIIANDKKWCDAYKNGDAATIASFYTEDGQLLPQNSEVVSGQENIKNFLQSLIDAGIITEVEIKPVEIEDHGDTAIEIGRYTMKGSDSNVVDEGKYIVIWKKVGDQLKWHRDMFSSNLPAQ